jgi:hypothetical protein
MRWSGGVVSRVVGGGRWVFCLGNRSGLTETIPLVYDGDVDVKPRRRDVLALGGFGSAPCWQAPADILQVEGHRETTIRATGNEHLEGLLTVWERAHVGVQRTESSKKGLGVLESL